MRHFYYWNLLYNECQDIFNDTYKHTLDTQDYVPLEHINEQHAYILKRQKKVWRLINKEAKRYRRALRKAKISEAQDVIDLVPGSFLSEEDGSIIYLLPCPTKAKKGEQANVQEEERAEE